MSISPIPLSSLKKEQQLKSQVNNYQYHLYECAYLLRVKKLKNDGENELEGQNDVDIVMSNFYEGSGRCLLVLICSNSSLLLYLREDGEIPVTKQLNWFQNPSKRIVALSIDPLRGAWILCACRDSSLYLIPALAQLKDTVKIINASPTWSQTDLSRIPFAKSLKGRPTCVVWWHTLDDRNVGIIGTESGELIFLDIAQHQEIGRTAIKEKIVKLELLQDIHERTSHVLIYTVKRRTLQLLLEQPSKSADFAPPSSLTHAFDMGYDMVADCNVESILHTEQHENKDEIQLFNRLEVLPQDFRYGIHNLNDRILTGKHDEKFHALEVFSDIKRVPEYVYHVPPNSLGLLLCQNFMFAIVANGNKITLNILSRQLSATSFGRQGLKLPDPSRKTEIQVFKLIAGETFLHCYKVHFNRPSSWSNLFPHKSGYKDECQLSSFIIVTKDGVLECRPRVSPEHYFTELAIKTGIEVAEKIGVTLDLNVSLLCEFVADRLIKERDVQTAVKFYNLSKCPPIKRAAQLVEFSTVTESLIFIKQVLKKQPTNLSGKERKQLSNMAILCYVEQTLESQRSGTFSKNLADSFKSFICDNFDYDEQITMQLLVSYGLIDNLFEVAKTRGRIDDALEKLSSCGLFLLTQTVQNMLLDCGYGDVVCKASHGMFIKHMQPEDAAKFLLAQPDITKRFINIVSQLLLKLEESTLLQIARVFDPSRQFIKPVLERLDANRKKRADSSLSLNSTTSSVIVDDPTLPSTSDIIVIFLRTIIALNSKRKGTAIPDLRLISRHLSGQLSWSGSMYMRSDSMGSNEILMSEMSRVKVACGRHHLAFVTDDKELYTWGRASYGRLGHGDLIEERSVGQPMRVESLHMHGIQVLSVACGALHTIALCEEGVFAWGYNKYGQLGVGDTRKRSRPVLLSDLSSKQVNSIVCGQYHSLALTMDYKAYSWGWGVHGQLGLNGNENQITPQFIQLLKGHRAVQVAAGYAHSAVLTSKGQVFTFGAGLYGQLGIGINTKCTTPQLVESLASDSIYLIACGSFDTLAVSDEQTIFCWGRNYHQFHICGKAESARYGRHMASNTTDISHRYLPEDLPFKLQQPINQLVCGNWHYMALTSMNYVYTWGCNDCGQLGHYNKIEQPAPRLVKALSRRSIVGIAAGSEFSVSVDSEDQLLAWGRADGGLIGIENENAPTSSVARRSAFSVLAPTAVPGLPIHFDQVSIDSTQSVKREFMFDQNYDLPDLSSVGQDQAPYSCEAVLLSLFKLKGLYEINSMAQYALHTKQWFVLSFCYELQEKWDQAFIYRTRSVRNYYSTSHDTWDRHSFADKMFLIVTDFLNKFEDLLSENFEEDTSLVAMVICFNTILQYWLKDELNFQRLEDVLKKHMESLCPLYTIVFFGFLSKSRQITSTTLRFALYHVTKQHAAIQKLSSSFFIDLLSQVIKHMDSGSNWYSFLSDAESGENDGYVNMCLSTPVEETTLSRDEMLKEIIEHKRKILTIKPYISLSNAVAATLAAASVAHQVQSDTYGLTTKSYDKLSTDEPDSTVFTCCHNLPRYYMLETVIPEFQSRMSELPEPLVNTADVMARFYKAADIRIPMACPYCVYNNLRNEQLHVLRETGTDIMNDRSTVWEI